MSGLPRRYTILLALALSLGLFAPSAAIAQDSGDVASEDGGDEAAAAEERPSAELTDEQITLNDAGVRSLIEKDYAGAVAMLTRSIKLGESNIAYLNLGRAYQKLGECNDARDALEKVRTAPVVENPPPDEVNARAEEFLAELEQECDFDEAPDEPGAEEDTPEKTSGEAPESEELPNPRLRPEPQPEPEAGGSSKTAGIILLSSGLAIAGGGVGLHFWAVDERSQIEEATRNDAVQITEFTQTQADEIQEKANTIDTVGLSMVIGGAAIAGVGTYLFLTSGSTETSGRSQLSVSPGRDGATLQWRLRF